MSGTIRKKLAWMAIGLLLGGLPNLLACPSHGRWPAWISLWTSKAATAAPAAFTDSGRSPTR